MNERIYQDSLPIRDKVMRLLWGGVWLFLFRPTPRWLLDGWRIAILRIFGAKIGQGCRVAPSCRVWTPWTLSMGDRSVLAEGVDCYNVAQISIGDNVCVSQRSYLCTASHDIRSLRRPLTHEPISIANHVWVCAEAFVGPGVSLGEGAIVAARGVVTKSVDSWTVVGGNPAKVIKKRELCK